jgi:hypothetical protein
MPHINGVIHFMLQATRDEDEVVSLEACEFWPAIADTNICHDALAPHLPRYRARVPTTTTSPSTTTTTHNTVVV